MKSAHDSPFFVFRNITYLTKITISRHLLHHAMVTLWLQRWHLAPSGVGANTNCGPFFLRRGSVFEEPDLSAEWLNQQRQPVAIA
ncbi:hypothetical protein KPSB59_2870053 [Klebsiella quasipneumoniae subsp. quasipneumoniae]|nr:hypothetical protein KPSB59_2870053 [Klebsiella quasipneumoniae subsp. quasipneumoniae]